MEENNFFEKVYSVVRKIPEGKLTSYGAIAKYIGAPKSARMVGYAMNSSHNLGIPAHRVLNRNGVLTGKFHFPGLNMMKNLLEAEGHKIQEDQVMNFKKVFWDPSLELPPFAT